MAARLYDYQGFGRYLPDNAAESAFCTAVCVGTEAAFQLAENPGLWSDPVNAPDEIIRGMARRAGLRGAEGQTIQRLRERLSNPPAFEVGSSAAIAEAVRALLPPGANVAVQSNWHPIDGATDLHTTVTVDPDDAGTWTTDQLTVAAEQGAPDWVVVHVVIADGLTIDELTGDIDDYTGSIDEL